MRNPVLKEFRRVTGWHFLFDHEAFPLLLAAISSTTVLWFYPGIDRIHASYFPQIQNTASIYMAVPQSMTTSVSEVEMYYGEEELPESEVVGEL